jgi:hypothetical protein
MKKAHCSILWLILIMIGLRSGSICAQSTFSDTFDKFSKDFRYDPTFITIRIRMGSQFLIPAAEELINAQTLESSRASAIQLMVESYALLREVQGNIEGIIAKRAKKGDSSPTLKWQTETIWDARTHIRDSIRLMRRAEPHQRDIPAAIQHLNTAYNLVERVLQLRMEARSVP